MKKTKTSQPYRADNVPYTRYDSGRYTGQECLLFEMKKGNVWYVHSVGDIAAKSVETQWDNFCQWAKAS